MHYMPVRGVLFDLDDTLFDHEHATLAALRVLRAEEPAFGGWSPEEFAVRHGAVLEAMHVEVLAGQRSIEDARAERFRRLLEAAGRVPPPAGRPEAVAWRYRAAYEAAWQPVPGAGELLAALRGTGVLVAVVTNNQVAEQEQKLRHCALDGLIDALVTSEGVGVAKPEPRIFAAALDRLDLNPADAVMVGDAWHTDIAGALASGIRPIWFNRRRAPSPDATVAELTSLEPAEWAMSVVLGT
jgi:HAD superfamily hydrolase (TIGR01662 family)